MKRTNYSFAASKARLFTYTSVLAIIIMTALSALPSYSQIPNASFENWTSGNPDGWKTTNVPPTIVNITKTTDAHNGSSAVQGTVTSMSGITIPCAMATGVGGGGYPETTKPAALHGWYKLTSVGGDLLHVYFAFKKNGAGIGGGTFSTATSTTGYTEFVANSY
jgi:hypothetical protein